MFAIVQEQQRAARSESSRQRRERGLAGVLVHTRHGDAVRYEPRVRDWSQLDEPDTIRTTTDDRSGHFNGNLSSSPKLLGSALTTARPFRPGGMVAHLSLLACSEVCAEHGDAHVLSCLLTIREMSGQAIHGSVRWRGLVRPLPPMVGRGLAALRPQLSGSSK